ncbi:hypothetical protein ACTWPT_44750 [Nonomuraea sp. 3N208]
MPRHAVSGTVLARQVGLLADDGDELDLRVRLTCGGEVSGGRLDFLDVDV